MHHPIPFTIGWIILITAVVAPLAIRTFRAAPPADSSRRGVGQVT